MNSCCICCRNTLMPNKILRVFLLRSATNSEEFLWCKKFHGLLSQELKIMARFWKGSWNRKFEVLSTEYTGFDENSQYISAPSWLSLALENYTWECTFLSTYLDNVLNTNLLKVTYSKLTKTSHKFTCLSKDKYYLKKSLWLMKIPICLHVSVLTVSMNLLQIGFLRVVPSPDTPSSSFMQNDSAEADARKYFYVILKIASHLRKK